MLTTTRATRNRLAATIRLISLPPNALYKQKGLPTNTAPIHHGEKETGCPCTFDLHSINNKTGGKTAWDATQKRAHTNFECPTKHLKIRILKSTSASATDTAAATDEQSLTGNIAAVRAQKKTDSPRHIPRCAHPFHRDAVDHGLPFRTARRMAVIE